MKMAIHMTKILTPQGALAAISLTVGAHAAIHGYAGAATLADADQLILKFVMPLVLVFWVRSDYQRSRYWPCFEYDLFVWVAWPVTLLHYLVHTRGVRGLWVYLGLWGLFLFPALCVGVAVVVSGVRNMVSP